VLHSWLRVLRRHLGRQEEPTRGAVVEVDLEAEELARQIGATQLAEAREELARADGKASILLAATGVGVGAVLGGAVSADWTPVQLGDPWAVIWVGGFSLILGGIGCLVTAVYPRWKRGADDEAELYFFGHAAKMKSAAEIEAAIRRTAERPLLRTSDQLMHVARIIERKYLWIQRGIWMLVIGLAIILATTIGANVAS
jgi:hypothetical protein